MSIPLLLLLGSAAYGAPTISSVNIETLSEGTEASFRVSHDGSGATTTWNFGNGDTGSGDVAYYTYDDDGTWALTVTVTDSTGSDSHTEIVSVANVDPTIDDLSGDSSGDEGESLSFSCTASDPGDDTVSYAWSFSDGGTDSGGSVTHAFVDDGSYTATCTASDEDGGSTEESMSVTVANLAPELALSGDSAGTEGDSFDFDAGMTDAGADDTHTYIWIWGDGDTTSGTSATESHVYDQDGSYTVTTTVIDSDGGTNSDTLSVTVANGPPTSTTITGDASGDEGDTLSWSCEASDPGVEDTLSYSWDFGDGGTASGDSASYAYTDDGTYALVCDVDDGDGGSDSDTLTVVIANLDPVIDSASGDAAVDEGSEASFEASATDAGDDTLTYTWDFGDGSTDTGSSVGHTWSDDGSYTVTLTVDDGDGGSATTTLSTKVANVAPTISGEPETTMVEGDSYAFAPSAGDVGSDDVLSFSGTVPEGVTLDESSGAVAWETTWRDQGSHTFTVIVSDDDGASAELSWKLEVSRIDEDRDGMSDLYEDEFGLDSTDPTDATDDDDGDGRSNVEEYLDGTDPGSYDGPSAPVLTSPADGGETDITRPTFAWENSVSPVDAELSYLLELYEDAELTLLLTEAADIAEGEKSTNWTCDVELSENTWYHWRAAAEDASVTGDWSEAAAFFVNTLDEAPSAPGIRWPLDGASVDSASPELSLDAAVDPDEDSVTYTFILEDDAGEEVEGEVGVEAEAWTPDGALTDGQTYCWYAYATDEHGLEGDDSETACFTVDTSNEAPSAPLILTPEDGLSVGTTEPEVLVEAGVDPEGRPTWEVFQLDTDSGFGSEDRVEAWVESGADGFTAWTPGPLEDGLTYHLRVLCTDGAADSDWDQISFVVADGNTPPNVPELSSPGDGEQISAGSALVITAPYDADGDAIVRIDLEVTNSDGVIAAVEALVPDDVGEARWQSFDLADGTYDWTARAIDERLGASDWAEASSFEITEEAAVEQPGCGCGLGVGSTGGLSALLLPWLVMLRRRRQR